MLFPILLLAGALYISLAAEWPKFSRAEVFFAECTKEMIAVHNWVTPLYHAHPFFDKPILMYWLIGSFFTLFGASHLAARIPSVLAALAVVSAISIWTKHFFGKRAATIAAMALASSFMFLSFAALCMSDMLLILFETATMIFLYAGYLKESKRSLLWSLASITMGLAFITKGPVGVVLPALAFGSFLLITKKLSMVKLHHVLIVVCAVVLIGTPWFFAAYKANGSWALAYFFIRENFQRFAGSTYDTHKPLWFMLTSLMSGFAPWSIILPFALVKDFKLVKQNVAAVRQNPQKLFLWLWLATVVGFFSLSRGKCDYYALPAYPAAAALVGAYLAELIEHCQNHGSRFANILRAAPAIIFCTICLGGIAFAFCGLPAIGKLLYTEQVRPLIEQTPSATRIVVFEKYSSGIDEITFQTGREPVRIDTVEQLQEFFSKPGLALAIVPEDVFAPLSNTSKLRVAKRINTISQPVTPGFIIKYKGRLTDSTPLLVVVNY